MNDWKTVIQRENAMTRAQAKVRRAYELLASAAYDLSNNGHDCAPEKLNGRKVQRIVEQLQEFA